MSLRALSQSQEVRPVSKTDAPQTGDIDVIHQLDNWTPSCDWGGCERTPTEGYAFCPGHRESLTIDYNGARGAEQ